MSRKKWRPVSDEDMRKRKELRDGCVTIATPWAIVANNENRITGTMGKGSVGAPMRIIAVAVFAVLVTVPAEAAVAGLDRSLSCKPLAERGRVWADCCTQSYARNPNRSMSRQARLREIERCVRTRLRT